MEGQGGTSLLLKEAYKRWCSLLLVMSSSSQLITTIPLHSKDKSHSSSVSSRSSSSSSSFPAFTPVHWKKTLLDINGRKKPMGIKLTKKHFGAMVLAMTPDSPLRYLEKFLIGAILVEIGCVNVLLESFQSITSTLRQVSGPGNIFYAPPKYSLTSMCQMC